MQLRSSESTFVHLAVLNINRRHTKPIRIFTLIPKIYHFLSQRLKSVKYDIG